MHDRSDPTPVSLTLSLGDDTFSCEGSLRDVWPFLNVWLAARVVVTSDPEAQAKIDALTARAKQANDRLGAAVADTTPT